MFRPVQLPSQVEGELFLHSMPGRFEPLEETLAAIQGRGIQRVVCLTPLEEVWRKSTAYACLLEAGTFSWRQKMFPIKDFNVPEDREAYLGLARELASALRSGERLLIHCAGGIGRTGTLAVVILLALGLGELEALQAVEMAGSGPENDKQRALVTWCARRLQQPG